MLDIWEMSLVSVKVGKGTVCTVLLWLFSVRLGSLYAATEQPYVLRLLVVVKGLEFLTRCSSRGTRSLRQLAPPAI